MGSNLNEANVALDPSTGFVLQLRQVANDFAIHAVTLSLVSIKSLAVVRCF